LVGSRHTTGGAYGPWRLAPPARVSTRLAGMRLLTGDIDFRARMDVYACRDGALELQLIAPEKRTVTLYRDGAVLRTIALSGGVPWTGSIPAPAAGGDSACTFELVTQGGGVHADRFEFVRRA
jgi:hypothetical protein